METLKDESWPNESSLDEIVIHEFIDESGVAVANVDFTFTGKESSEDENVDVDDAFFEAVADTIEAEIKTKVEALAASQDGTVLPVDLDVAESDFGTVDITTENEEPEYDTFVDVEAEF